MKLHIFHSYKDVGQKFISSYFPYFFDPQGNDVEYGVTQNMECKKCGKHKHYTLKIRGRKDYLTPEVVANIYNIEL